GCFPLDPMPASGCRQSPLSIATYRSSSERSMQGAFPRCRRKAAALASSLPTLPAWQRGQDAALHEAELDDLVEGFQAVDVAGPQPIEGDLHRTACRGVREIHDDVAARAGVRHRH